ncbi:MucR family transcriptional regulator [Sphingopyxis sp. BSN-002]|nr:MucR family transcriptional regulator [Sphingopyxis sp. BSN-002]UKK86296.1 MucR family transcriptional regulator [Sphingopyxis sp. BSN-002]
MQRIYMQNEDLVTLTADIAAAYVSNNSVAVSDLAVLINKIHGSLTGLSLAAEPEVTEAVPIVSIRASVKPDYLVCLECGQKAKTLRRHLNTAHELDEAAYRDKYNLPASYPMTAPSYSEKRREMAKSIGLGRQGTGGRKPAGRTKK